MTPGCAQDSEHFPCFFGYLRGNNPGRASMRVGVPKEIKNHEYRVGLTPAAVGELIAHGHEVFVETKAGSGIDFSDAAYEKVGAKILPTAADVFAQDRKSVV